MIRTETFLGGSGSVALEIEVDEATGTFKVLRVRDCSPPSLASDPGLAPPGRHGQPAEMNLWRIVVDLEVPWRGAPDPLGIPTHQYRQHVIYTVLAGEDVYPDAKAVAKAMYPSYRVIRVRCVEWLAIGDVAPYPHGIAFETNKVWLEAKEGE